LDVSANRFSDTTGQLRLRFLSPARAAVFRCTVHAAYRKY